MIEIICYYHKYVLCIVYCIRNMHTADTKVNFLSMLIRMHIYHTCTQTDIQQLVKQYKTATIGFTKESKPEKVHTYIIHTYKYMHSFIYRSL